MLDHMRIHIRKAKKLCLVALALLISSHQLAAEQPKKLDSWYTGFPKKFDSFPEGTKLSSADFSEIPLSQFEAAEQLLESKRFVKIQNGYFGQFPQCPRQKLPYLTRAVFERTTGTFFVHVVGSEIFVMNASFGPAAKLRRSALVVCLDNEPTKAYTDIRGAM